MRETLYKIERKYYYTRYYKTSNDINEKENTCPKDGEDSFYSNREVYNSKKNKEEITIFVVEKYSTEEKDFEENYGNPLCLVTRQNNIIVIEKDGDKVSLKLFNSVLNRKVGKVYFTKSTRCDFLTYNKKTGNLYNGFLSNYHKKRKVIKKIRVNNFYSSVFNNFLHLIRNQFGRFFKETSSNYLYEITNTFINACGLNYDLVLSNDDIFYKDYLEKKFIKFPNNFPTFRMAPYETLPKLPEIKKSGNKLVDAFMKKNSLTGKVLKKALHEVSYINLQVLKNSLSMLGPDVLYNDYELLKACLEWKDNFWFTTQQKLQEIFSPTEFKRVLFFYRYAMIEQQINTNTVFDHIRFYIELKAYGELDLRWLSTDLESFQKEHLDWTDKLSKYKNGYYKRIYPEFIDKICSDRYNSNGVVYYPVLLRTTSDYNDESQVQSNCVRTYIGYPASIIFSLRKNGADSKERLTAEYLITNDNGKIKSKMIQGRIRFNNIPTEEWNKALEVLNERVESYVKSKFYENVKIEKECVNGVKINSNSIWEENVIKWENTIIYNSYNAYII